MCLICSVVCGVWRAVAAVGAHSGQLRAPARRGNAPRCRTSTSSGGCGSASTEIEATKRDLARQIAENHNAAETLRESENLLRAIIDNSSALIYVKDLDGRYLLTNAQHARVFGYSRNEIVGKTPYDLFPADVAASVIANDRQVLAANRPLQFEEVVPQDDGEHTYLSVKFAVRDPERHDLRNLRHLHRHHRAQADGERAAAFPIHPVGAHREQRRGHLGAGSGLSDPAAELGGAAAISPGVRDAPEIGADFRELLPADVRTHWGAQFQQALSGQRIVDRDRGHRRTARPQQFLVSLNPIIDGTAGHWA